MAAPATIYATQLRQELAERNRVWAKVRPHVESFGSNPVIVYEPENGRHGNFYDPAYSAITAHPDWPRRFDKIHAQGRSLPRPPLDPARRWRELDSCMSSDALLMNILCTPGVSDSPTVRGLLGIDNPADQPAFGFRARVPLANGASTAPRSISAGVVCWSRPSSPNPISRLPSPRFYMAIETL